MDIKDSPEGKTYRTQYGVPWQRREIHKNMGGLTLRGGAGGPAPPYQLFGRDVERPVAVGFDIKPDHAG